MNVRWVNDPKRCGQWVQASRLKCGLTQKELADIVGCSRPTLSRIELGNGRESQFFQTIVLKLAEMIGEVYNTEKNGI